MMIRLFALACLLLSGLNQIAAAQSRDVYTIRGITVDERAPTVIEAQQKAFAAAKLAGASQLIARLTLTEDLAQATTPITIDQALADQLAAAVDVEEETAGAGRYRGRLAVVYNPATVRNLLNRSGVLYTDRQAPRAVIFPIASAGLSAACSQTWPDASKGSLVPTATSRVGGIQDTSEWDDVADAVSDFGAQRGILAELKGNQGAYKVTLTSVSPSGARIIGSTQTVSSLPAAVQAVSAVLDRDWKESAIIRDTGRTLIEATVLYTSLAEWNTLRSSLVKSPLVSNFQTRAISTDGAVIAFAFAGDTERLDRDLRDRGVAITMEPIGWVLKSAVTGRR